MLTSGEPVRLLDLDTPKLRGTLQQGVRACDAREAAANRAASGARADVRDFPSRTGSLPPHPRDRVGGRQERRGYPPPRGSRSAVPAQPEPGAARPTTIIKAFMSGA